MRARRTGILKRRMTLIKKMVSEGAGVVVTEVRMRCPTSGIAIVPVSQMRTGTESESGTEIAKGTGIMKGADGTERMMKMTPSTSADLSEIQSPRAPGPIVSGSGRGLWPLLKMEM